MSYEDEFNNLCKIKSEFVKGLFCVCNTSNNLCLTLEDEHEGFATVEGINIARHEFYKTFVEFAKNGVTYNVFESN